MRVSTLLWSIFIGQNWDLTSGLKLGIIYFEDVLLEIPLVIFCNLKERAAKSKSVHFDGSDNHLAAASSSISIIGKPPKNSDSSPNLARDSNMRLIYFALYC